MGSEEEMAMSNVDAIAARKTAINLGLWFTVVFFGLTPIFLGLSLAVAQSLHLVH